MFLQIMVNYKPKRTFYNTKIHFRYRTACVPYSLVVRIPGFHPGGPGSIPGVGNVHFLSHAADTP